MSYYDYAEAASLWRGDPSFYALIMAAMKRADTPNANRLRAAFPDVWRELQMRYNAPGGVLDSDPAPLRKQVLGV